MSQRGGELWTADRARLRPDVLPFLVSFIPQSMAFLTSLNTILASSLTIRSTGDASFYGAFGEELLDAGLDAVICGKR